MNLHNPNAVVVAAATSTTYTVVSGVAGFVNTDISATVGDNSGNAIFFADAAAASTFGCRAPSDIAASQVGTGGSITIMGHYVLGHIELYRDVAQNNFYHLIGTIV